MIVGCHCGSLADFHRRFAGYFDMRPVKQQWSAPDGTSLPPCLSVQMQLALLPYPNRVLFMRGSR
jgi:hypothetical protein